MQDANGDKKLVFISYHYLPNPNFRSSAVWEVIRSKYPRSLFYYADWDHLNKKRIEASADSRMLGITVPEYHRNLSIARVCSHLVFSLKLLFRKELREADILYASVPPNLVLVPLILIRLFKPKTKVICDVVDLWPEAIPLSSCKKKFFDILATPFWTIPRNLAYKTTDLFISHCKYFLKEIGPAFLPERNKHLPLCLMDFREKSLPAKSMDNEIRFLLLGSINNIFDLEKCLFLFKNLLQNKNRKIILEVIGLGESLPTLLQRLRSELPELTVENHGPIFDREKKDVIMDRIHFGLNLYKDTTAIGISYKSIEYMAHGIPLINSAQGDLYDLIDEHHMGYNIVESVEGVSARIGSLSNSQYQSMKEAASALYSSTFSRSSFEHNLLRFIEETA